MVSELHRGVRWRGGAIPLSPEPAVLSLGLFTQEQAQEALGTVHRHDRGTIPDCACPSKKHHANKSLTFSCACKKLFL